MGIWSQYEATVHKLAAFKTYWTWLSFDGGLKC